MLRFWFFWIRNHRYNGSGAGFGTGIGQIVKSPKIPSLSGGVENLSAELRGFLKHTDILRECGAEEIS